MVSTDAQRAILSSRSPAADRVNQVDAAGWRGELGWVAAAAGTGSAVTLVGTDLLDLPRAWFVAVLAVTVSLLMRGYLRWSGIQIAPIVRQRWLWATIRGLLLGFILIALVLPEDETAAARGAHLLFNVVWLGIGYGVFDALLLNVLPMTATWRAATRLGWTSSVRGRIGSSLLSLSATLFVTAAYHLGFPEFRGLEIAGPIGGNLLIGLGYVLAPNPITTLVGHVMLHVAAVLGGADGTYQLPPHT